MRMSPYETDFYAWAQSQGSLLRSGRLSDVDIEHLAEEIESMGRREKRELMSRLAVLLMHLRKWQAQPMLRGNARRATIKLQRREIGHHLADNPSLRGIPDGVLTDAYGDAVVLASRETGLAESAFPSGSPWTFAEIMDHAFRPDGDRTGA
jgi:hypothetical protein